eukprot:1460601-Pyramimonas_sp.AAC.1
MQMTLTRLMWKPVAGRSSLSGTKHLMIRNAFMCSCIGVVLLRPRRGDRLAASVSCVMLCGPPCDILSLSARAPEIPEIA